MFTPTLNHDVVMEGSCGTCDPRSVLRLYFVLLVATTVESNLQ